MVEASGGTLDDDHLLIGRTAPKSGRSRAFVGGVPVPLAQAGDVLDQLVAVHGQAHQLRLRSAARQRDLLDDYIGAELTTLRERYRRRRDEWLGVREQLAQTRESFEDYAAQMTALQDALEQFDDVAPLPGEDEQLTAEADRLGNVSALLVACQNARLALLEDDADTDARSRVEGAHRALAKVGDLDPQLAALADQVAALGAQLADVGADLVAYATALDEDPGRLDWVQLRRAEIARVTRQHGGSVAAALEWAANTREELAQWDGGAGIDRLVDQERQYAGETAQLAEQLTAMRSQAAEEVSTAVKTELRALGMPGWNRPR